MDGDLNSFLHFSVAADEKEKAGDYAGAISALETARSVEPSHAGVLLSLARCWLRKDGVPGLIDLMSSIDDPQVLTYVCKKYVSAGNAPALASEFLREALKGTDLRPTPDVLLHNVRGWLGHDGLYRLAFEPDEAADPSGAPPMPRLMAAIAGLRLTDAELEILSAEALRRHEPAMLARLFRSETSEGGERLVTALKRVLTFSSDLPAGVDDAAIELLSHGPTDTALAMTQAAKYLETNQFGKLAELLVLLNDIQSVLYVLKKILTPENAPALAWALMWHGGDTSREAYRAVAFGVRRAIGPDGFVSLAFGDEFAPLEKEDAPERVFRVVDTFELEDFERASLVRHIVEVLDPATFLEWYGRRSDRTSGTLSASLEIALGRSEGPANLFRARWPDRSAGGDDVVPARLVSLQSPLLADRRVFSEERPPELVHLSLEGIDQTWVVEDRPQVIVSLERALHLTGTGALTEQGELIRDGTCANMWRWDQASKENVLGRYVHPEFSPEVPYLLRVPRNIKKVEGCAVYAGDYQNFFHFIINYISKLWFTRSAYPVDLSEMTVILRYTGEDVPPFVKGFLELLGVRWEKVLFVNAGDAVAADQLIVLDMPVFKPREGEGDYGQISRRAMSDFRCMLHGERPFGRGRRLFLRRGAVKHRRLLNEDEVAAQFERQGFEIVDGSKYSAREQIEMVREASMIAGPSGAQMGLGMYAPPGCAFIDLTLEPGGIWYWFALPIAALGLHYHQVGGRISQRLRTVVNSDFWIDPEEAVAKVLEVERSQSEAS